MTHSDSITLLLDLKASDLIFPLEDFVKEGISKLTGQNKALIFNESFIMLWRLIIIIFVIVPVVTRH